MWNVSVQRGGGMHQPRSRLSVGRDWEMSEEEDEDEEDEERREEEGVGGEEEAEEEEDDDDDDDEEELSEWEAGDHLA